MESLLPVGVFVGELDFVGVAVEGFVVGIRVGVLVEGTCVAVGGDVVGARDLLGCGVVLQGGCPGSPHAPIRTSAS